MDNQSIKIRNKYYTQEKLYLKNHGAELIESILSCYVKRYCNVYSERNNKGSIDDGDNILFHVCHVLNSPIWPDLANSSNEDEIKLSLQLNTTHEINEKYKSMPIIESASLESMQSGFTKFVHYPYLYFDINNMKPVDLWSKLCTLGKEREDWKPIMLLIELCRCTPFSNATLERFFSHFKFIKTEIRSRLSNKSLNSNMRIKMNNLSVVDFNTKYSSQCTDYWYNIKEWSLGQTKRKKYAPRNSTKRKHSTFNVNDLTSESDSLDTSDEEILLLWYTISKPIQSKRSFQKRAGWSSKL